MVEDLESRQDIDEYASTESSTLEHVQVDRSGGVVRITLNHPPANLLSSDLMRELATSLESLEFEPETRLVALLASGKYFSAGFEINDHLGDRAYPMLQGFRRIFAALAKVDKPTLSVVQGPALGAGCLLAAGCDIVLAAESAKFAHPEIRGGVFNAMAAALLPRLVGRKRAFEMILLGGTLSAAEAQAAGLVTRVVPDDRLEAEAAALVHRFEESSAPIVQLARRAIAGGLDLPLEEAVEHAEDVYLNQLMATEDVEEGLRAVVEKRKPDWKGR
ncbi:MAG: enoyl-CoA hydratase/isomerase family protein [Acidobacteria bacterium]|jgi:cyclohexa-1,5-dienecarbonyl-CoA hydratase|nr:enoyl-CoA hydratase/isomerase family protein [Acidobacteriota bacterium]